MGGPNKLMALFGDQPLIYRTVERATKSHASATIVITGHQADRIEAAIAGLDVKIVHNPDFADGLASSLKAGIAALPADIGGALIVLGDMPGIEVEDLDRMIDAFRQPAARPWSAPLMMAGAAIPYFCRARFFLPWRACRATPARGISWRLRGRMQSISRSVRAPLSTSTRATP